MPDTTTPLRRILRRSEAALYVGLKAGTLSNWASRGLGPATIPLGIRAVGYEVAELDRWLAERAASKAVEAAATG